MSPRSPFHGLLLACLGVAALQSEAPAQSLRLSFKTVLGPGASPTANSVRPAAFPNAASIATAVT